RLSSSPAPAPPRFSPLSLHDALPISPVVIYQTANAVALYLIPLVAMAASILVHGRGRAQRWLSGLFLAVALPACLLSFSRGGYLDRKSTRLNSSHLVISYAVFCLKKK